MGLKAYYTDYYDSAIKKMGTIKGKAFASQKLAGIFLELLQIVYTLDSHRIHHGDIRPDNVIVAKNDRIVVIDWEGMAHDNRVPWSMTKVFAPSRLVSSYYSSDNYLLIDELESLIYTLYAIESKEDQLPWYQALTLVHDREQALLYTEENKTMLSHILYTTFKNRTGEDGQQLYGSFKSTLENIKSSG